MQDILYIVFDFITTYIESFRRPAFSIAASGRADQSRTTMVRCAVKMRSLQDCSHRPLDVRICHLDNPDVFLVDGGTNVEANEAAWCGVNHRNGLGVGRSRVFGLAGEAWQALGHLV